MVDEPDEVYRYLDDYNDKLLGAVLIRPPEIFGSECTRLKISDIRSTVLAIVFDSYRDNPAITTEELVQAIGAGNRDEVARAMSVGLPWYAQYYARQIRRLEGSRRKFLKAQRDLARYYRQMESET